MCASTNAGGRFWCPAYLAESIWQWLCGRRAYLDNRFERQARGL